MASKMRQRCAANNVPAKDTLLHLMYLILKQQNIFDNPVNLKYNVRTVTIQHLIDLLLFRDQSLETLIALHTLCGEMKPARGTCYKFLEGGLCSSGLH